MKLREIMAAIREYPNIRTDLELARDELGRTQAALQESEKECGQLLIEKGERQAASYTARRKEQAMCAALTAFPPELRTTDQLRQFYDCVAPFLDADGFGLYKTARMLTGFDLYRSYPYEDARGEFEMADGRRLMVYLEVECFGKADWEIVCGTGYERATNMRVDRDSTNYKAFQQQLYEAVLRDMSFGDLLPPEVPQKLQNKETKGRDAHAR